MQLKTLETFIKVVECGGFSAAARVLGVAPPVVTRAIATLEKEIGVPLLQRSTRKVFVTDEGRVFYRRACSILSTYEAALHEARPHPEEVRGVVRAVLITLLVPFGILDALKVLLDEHPQLSVQIRFSDQAVDLVKGGWDVGLAVGAPPNSSNIAHSLGSLAAGLAATPEYLATHGTPLKPQDLAEHNCLRFISERSQETWELLGPDGQHQAVAVGGRVEIDNSLALSEAMSAGLGIGLVPMGLLDRPGTKLVQVLPGWQFAPFPLRALVPASRNRVHRVRVFVEWLRAFSKRTHSPL